MRTLGRHITAFAVSGGKNVGVYVDVSANEISGHLHCKAVASNKCTTHGEAV